MDKWNDWYKNVTTNDIGSFRYGDTETYMLGYNFLKDCNKIEDWGCGTGGFKRYIKNDDNITYIGIDGSNTPFANIKADLSAYISNTEGIYMRHILEHNYEWEKILHNACKSFTKKMCLVLFTPLISDCSSREIAHNLRHGVDVPDLSFNADVFCNIFDLYNIEYTKTSIHTNTGYGVETIFYLSK